MIHGKKITLFLMDGTPGGRWTCELSNWTGKAYKIPRTMLKECADKVELTQAGVYFLLGRNDQSGKQLVYVGESENVFDRLCQHLKKDFWNEVITFISKDENLNKAHVKYLENRFFELAINAKRYNVVNDNVPTKPALSEPEKAELEEFIEHALVLVGALGHRIFEPIITTASNSPQEEHFFFKKGKVNAEGLRTTDGFVILAGATLNEKVSEKSVNKGIIVLRQKYLEEGKIANLKTTENILFSSPSSAADFLTGYSISGPAHWKNSEGKSLKDIEAEKAENEPI